MYCTHLFVCAGWRRARKEGRAREREVFGEQKEIENTTRRKRVKLEKKKESGGWKEGE